MQVRPVLTVTVGITEDRQVSISGQRHGIDRIEMYAAVGALREMAWTLAQQLLDQRPVAPTEPPEPKRWPINGN